MRKILSRLQALSASRPQSRYPHCFGLIVTLILALLSVNAVAQSRNTGMVDIILTSGGVNYIDLSNKKTLPAYNGFSPKERNLASYAIRYRAWDLMGAFVYKTTFYYELQSVLQGRTRSVDFNEISKYADLVRRYQAIRPIKVSYVIKVNLETKGGTLTPVRFKVNDNDSVYFESRSAKSYANPIFPPTLKNAFSSYNSRNPFTDSDTSDEKGLRQLLSNLVSVRPYESDSAIVTLDIKWPDDAIDEIGSLYDQYELDDETLELRAVRLSWTSTELRGKKEELRRERERQSQAAIAKMAKLYKVSPNPSNVSSSSTVRKLAITNPSGIELVYIPPGEFLMGSTQSEITEALNNAKRYDDWYERKRFLDETPQRRVSIKDGFWMGKYEVTQAQWEAVMGSKPSEFVAGCPQCPVRKLWWNEAKDFLAKLNARNDGFEYRLPSEAEWEYAARAGTATAFAFGNILNSTHANFDSNYPYEPTGEVDSEEEATNRRLQNLANLVNSREKTVVVGSYQPNAFGLYDMHGNVSEWCEDVYNSSYSNLAIDGTANQNGENPSTRVLRGGSANDKGHSLRSASRNGSSNGAGYIGFRVAAQPLTKAEGYEKALAQYAKAIESNPKNAEAYSARAKSHLENEEYDLAIADYTSILKFQPEDYRTYFARGIAYGSQKQHELAVADYTRVIQLKPEISTPYFKRGLTYAQQKKYELAVLDLNRALELDASDWSNYSARGLIYADQDKLDLAIVDYTEAIKIAPKSAVSFYLRGYAYYRLKNHDLALADVNKAIQIDPNDGKYYPLRAVVYCKQGNKADALADEKKVLELGGELIEQCH